MIILNQNTKQYNKNNIFEKLKKLAISRELEQSSSKNSVQYDVHTKNFKWFKYFFFKKPINLLFSLDQFLFEFSKKKPQKRRSGEFQQQLKEQKKITLFYGNLSKKELTKIIDNTKNYPGYFYQNFFSLLEKRLDVVLYRCGFVKTISGAGQLILHKKILVNDKVVTIPGYILQPGDCISVQSKHAEIVSKNLINSFNKSWFLKSPINKYKNAYPRAELKQELGSEKNKFFSKPTHRSELKQELGSESFIFQNKMFVNIQNILKKKSKFKNKRKLHKIINVYTHSILKKITSRAFLKIPQNSIPFKSNTYLTLIKYKPVISNQAKYLLFSLKKSQYLLSEKKPIYIYSKNYFFFKSKLKQLKFNNKKQTFLKKQSTNLYKNFDKQLNIKKFSTKLHIVNKNLLLKIFILIHSSRLLKHFIIPGFKKHLSKKNFFFRNVKLLKFDGLKPSHLEISYSLLKVIYLYSPQRIKYPFYINIDLISRAFK